MPKMEEKRMHVLTAKQGFFWADEPSFRVIAIFKDPLIALREKNKVEKAIKDALEKGEKDGQIQYMDANENHPYWKYVKQLDPGFTIHTDETIYEIHAARVMTVL